MERTGDAPDFAAGATQPAPGIAMLRRFAPQGMLERPFGVHTDENILLLIPEKRLPRYRVVMILLRVAIAVMVIVKILAVFGPYAHFMLLVGDMVIGTGVIALAVLLAGWTHTRDLRSRFHMDHLLLVPGGPGYLAQAMVLRPLGDVLLAVVIYYVISVVAFLFNLLWTLAIVGAGSAPPSFLLMIGSMLLLILAFQPPWMLIMAILMGSTATSAVRCEAMGEGNHVFLAVDVLFRAFLGVGSLIAGLVVLYIVSMMLVVVNASALVYGVIVLVAAGSVVVSRYLARTQTIPWIEGGMRRLGEELVDHWHG